MYIPYQNLIILALLVIDTTNVINYGHYRQAVFPRNPFPRCKYPLMPYRSFIVLAQVAVVVRNVSDHSQRLLTVFNVERWSCPGLSPSLPVPVHKTALFYLTSR